MGKTTGYHPISLHVIRGAAEYCGFEIGKIQRIAEWPAEEKAIYRIEVRDGPGGWRDWPPNVFRRQFQHCFLDDIKIKDVVMRADRPIIAIATVQMHRSPIDEALETQKARRK